MEELEVIYYSAPIPRNLEVLTVLGAVFDKVYFPGVYLPTEGFATDEIDKEIARIESYGGRRRPNDMMVGLLKFLRHAKTLRGFCEFTGVRDDFELKGKVPSGFAETIYQMIHGANPPGWHPMIPDYHSKMLPGDTEYVAYPDIYQYLALATISAAQTGIPLLNDLAGMPVAGADGASPHDNAAALSSLLAIECVRTALPQIPLLQPKELMEFRAENGAHLRTFRNAMLRYSRELNAEIKGLDRQELQRKTTFFVQTEIAPTLDELRNSIAAPNRPWHKRILDGMYIVPRLGWAFMTGNGVMASDALGRLMTTLVSEYEAAQDKRAAAKNAGLFYLLRLESHGKR